MLQISNFYVIGHPLGHSMSPFIHKRLFTIRGVDADYSAIDIPPERLETDLPVLLREAGGINVTIPHKQAVIPYLDGLRGRAELYRSVNTIKTGQEGCLGYNTDADGFLLALRDGDITLKGRVLLLGCGGVGRTFACEAALSGCKIVNAVRESDLKQADELRAYVHTLSPKTDYDITTLDEIGGEFDLLINATPVGMYPDCDAMPVKAPVLRNIAAVFDAVYNPAETLLLKSARANGAKALGGMPMLVWQAVAAHRIWFGADFDRKAVAQLIKDASVEMQRHFSEQ